MLESPFLFRFERLLVQHFSKAVMSSRCCRIGFLVLNRGLKQSVTSKLKRYSPSIYLICNQTSLSFRSHHSLCAANNAVWASALRQAVADGHRLAVFAKPGLTQAAVEPHGFCSVGASAYESIRTQGGCCSIFGRVFNRRPNRVRRIL